MHWRGGVVIERDERTKEEGEREGYIVCARAYPPRERNNDVLVLVFGAAGGRSSSSVLYGPLSMQASLHRRVFVIARLLAVYVQHYKTVSMAELPNPKEDPDLYSTIVKNMVHGPCGELNRSSPCMKDEKYTKRYPKPFSNETITDENRYSKYRRRSPEQGECMAKIKIRGNEEIQVDNLYSIIWHSGDTFDGGRTAHSCLKLLLNAADYVFSVCDITKSSAHGQILKQWKAIIWDECTMAHKKLLAALNRTLQDLRDNTNVMGEWLSQRIILATKNDIVNGIDNIFQEMIPGEGKIYNS
ncbi:hypothetical protein EVAR_44832_1 [Eumeta japonica]|uniref:ATP-dependent DNA helicase n=1 Tax=Eumeta variegata TaxID=151549 RepID=A0A4C1XB36_EUMVA|nr:hypothetical protein EVAR_44832_1 [Eumeta japonica]